MPRAESADIQGWYAVGRIGVPKTEENAMLRGRPTEARTYTGEENQGLEAP